MNSAFPCHQQKRSVTRRDFLWELGGGLGGVALAAMTNDAHAATNPLAAKAGSVTWIRGTTNRIWRSCRASL